MANTYHQIYNQTVFAVKYRNAVIEKGWRSQLIGVIGNLINEINCKTIIVNGVEDHVHCLLGLKPVVSVSELIKTVKAKTSRYRYVHSLRLSACIRDCIQRIKICCYKMVPAYGSKGVLSAKETGNGIPQEVLDKILPTGQAGVQPFFTTKPIGQGTGSGLSLSYDIVKAHGGELKVYTPPAGRAGKEGGGSEFVIQFLIKDNV